MVKTEKYNRKKRMRHMSWCIRNDIIIYYEAIDNYTGKLVLIDKGEKSYYQEEYRQPTYKKPLRSKDKVWWNDIMENYTNKYLEYNK